MDRYETVKLKTSSTVWTEKPRPHRRVRINNELYNIKYTGKGINYLHWIQGLRTMQLVPSAQGKIWICVSQPASVLVEQ